MSAVLFSFVTLRTLVQEVLDSDGKPAAVVAVGQRELGSQINQAPTGAGRVVFVPSGATYGAGRSYSVAERSIASMPLDIEAHVWGYDASAPEDEAVQHDAALALHDRVAVALRRIGFGVSEFTSGEWVDRPVERTFGKCFVITLSVTRQVIDDAWTKYPNPDADPPNPPLEPGVTTYLVTPSGDIPAC